jgi:hypothetical protein
MSDDAARVLREAINLLFEKLDALDRHLIALERRQQPAIGTAELQQLVKQWVREELDRLLDDEIHDQIAMAILRESGGLLSNLLDERGYPYRDDPGRQ